jgi:succinyl-diaminopimelate desuccinylase
MAKSTAGNGDDRFIIDIAKRLIPIQAISPESGGNGESLRADEICAILDEMGYHDYKRYDVQDDHDVKRSSVVLKVGNKAKTLWLISHIDTVPDGDRALWSHEPFKVTVDGDRMYGRGTSDDGQAVFLSFLLLKHLKAADLEYNLGLAFAADEEMGSKYGIQHLIDQNIFPKDDLLMVPDAGAKDGMDIEIAEKSILWIKFKVIGKQYHASMPAEAINANREGMKFMLELDEFLHKNYGKENPLFSPSYSTFEPTKREKNVDNINTIPGTEIMYLDCRILPEYDIDHVIDNIDRIIKDFEKRSPAKITYSFAQREQAPVPTSEDAEVVQKLKNAIAATRNGTPRIVGIGGGTCAAFFRKRGIPAVVWSTTIDEVAHQADEYCLISNIKKDRETLEVLLYK